MITTQLRTRQQRSCFGTRQNFGGFWIGIGRNSNSNSSALFLAPCVYPLWNWILESQSQCRKQGTRVWVPYLKKKTHFGSSGDAAYKVRRDRMVLQPRPCSSGYICLRLLSFNGINYCTGQCNGDERVERLSRPFFFLLRWMAPWLAPWPALWTLNYKVLDSIRLAGPRWSLQGQAVLALVYTAGRSSLVQHDFL
jgi:hypothetical protein